MNAKPKILLVEDDPNLGMLLKDYLELKGFDITLETDGERAFRRFSTDAFDLYVLDVMLPKMDGFTLAGQILKINKTAYIIFLTAKSRMDDLQQGFNLGADDYVTKPFNSEELLLRVKAVLRRKGIGNGDETDDPVLTIGLYSFDTRQQILSFKQKKIALTSKECQLLEILSHNKNQLVERNLILKTVWHDDSYFNARSMDVYISKLRKHLSLDPSLKIMNVHGEGYKLMTS